MSNFILTFEGNRVSFDAGVPSLKDIAVHLGRTPRWAGATKVFYPVLAHSLVVARLLPPELEIHGLLHDAGEAIIGDIPRPLKTTDIKIAERKILSRIYESLGIKMPGIEEIARVTKADQVALVAEARVLGPPGITDLDEFKYYNEEAECIVRAMSKFPPDFFLNRHGEAVKYFVNRVNELVTKELGKGEMGGF